MEAALPHLVTVLVAAGLIAGAYVAAAAQRRLQRASMAWTSDVSAQCRTTTRGGCLRSLRRTLRQFDSSHT